MNGSGDKIIGSGNVGIGATSPGFKLDVVGNAGFGLSTNGIQIGSVEAGTPGSDEHTIRSRGTDTELTLKSVGTGSLYFGNYSALAQMTSAGDLLPHADNDDNLGSVAKRWNTGFIRNLCLGDGSDCSDKWPLGYWTQPTSSNYLYATDTLKYVGIGTTTPAQKLDVAGIGKFGDYALIGTNIAAGYYQDSANGAYRALSASGDRGYYFQSYNGASTTMYVGLNGTYAGRVGIGTATPGYQLDVKGTAGFNTAIYGDGKIVAQTNDAYLRINQSSQFASGIWVGSSNLMLYGGHLYVGSQGGMGNVDIYGNGDAVNRVTINGSTNANSWFNTGGNVGIGTTTPGTSLDVQNGVVRTSNNTPTALRGFQAGNNFSLTMQGYNDCSGDAGIFHNAYELGDSACVGATAYKWVSAHGSFGSRAITMGYGTGINFFADNVATTAGSSFTPTQRMIITNTGNVGIGTTTPAYNLDVEGTAATGNTTTTLDGIEYSVIARDLHGSDEHTIRARGNDLTLKSIGTGSVYFGNYAAMVVANASGDLLPHLDNDDNLGSVAYRWNTGYIRNLCLGDGSDCASSWPTSYWSKVGNLLYTTDLASYVGIGTASPGTKLDILGNGTNDPYIRVRSNGATIGAHLQLIGGSTDISDIQFGDEIDGVTGKIIYYTRDNENSMRFETNSTEKMRITSTGDVGIGMTTPGAKLDINGQIKIQGGSPEAGRVLTSDDEGLATWEFMSESDPQTGTVTAGRGCYGIAGNIVECNDSFSWDITNNRLGVANTAPAYPLDVTGNARFTGGTIYNYSTSYSWVADGTNWNKFNTPYGSISLGPANASYAHIYTDRPSFYFDKGVHIGADNVFMNTSAGNSYINGGNVGIGTTAPGYKLHVNGNFFTTDGYTSGWWRNSARTGIYNQDYGTHFYTDSASYWRMSSNNGLMLNSTTAFDSAAAGYLYHDGGGFGLLSSDGNWRMRTMPGYQELYGTTYADSIQANIYYDRANTGYYVDPASSSRMNTLNYVDQAYIVDVRPQYMYDWNDAAYYMDMNNTSRLNYLGRNYGWNWTEYDWNDSSYYMDLNNTSILNQLRFRFAYDQDNTAYYVDPSGTSHFYELYLQSTAPTIQYYDSNWGAETDLQWWTHINDSRFYFLQGVTGTNAWAETRAYFGAATDAATTGLWIDGSYHCNGADIAEITPSVEPLQPSEVVSLDELQEGKLRRSARAYETNVAGVVSTNPGLLLNNGADPNSTPPDPSLEGEEAIKAQQAYDESVSEVTIDGIALTLAGRAPVQVTTENGPIKVGDLLVTSSKPGYAMRGDREKIKDIPGVVLGKAMGSLEDGEGTITVLISLQ
jgi:hypothetical protein